MSCVYTLLIQVHEAGGYNRFPKVERSSNIVTTYQFIHKPCFYFSPLPPSRSLSLSHTHTHTPLLLSPSPPSFSCTTHKETIYTHSIRSTPPLHSYDKHNHMVVLIRPPLLSPEHYTLHSQSRTQGPAKAMILTTHVTHYYKEVHYVIVV